MTEQKTIQVEVGFYTLSDLFKSVAKLMGLKLRDAETSRVISRPLRSYTLDHTLMAALAKQGIRQHPRTDDTITLADENPQNETPGYHPSNYWNFKRPDGENGVAPELRIDLCVELLMNFKERGIVLLPRAQGGGVSPVDPLPNFRMFRALTEADPKPLRVAKRIAANEGGVVVTWSDLGLGGLRTLSMLFNEFKGGNENIETLARKVGVFEPNPYALLRNGGSLEFVPERAQPLIFRAWNFQLENYRESLIV